MHKQCYLPLLQIFVIPTHSDLVPVELFEDAFIPIGMTLVFSIFYAVYLS